MYRENVMKQSSESRKNENRTGISTGMKKKYERISGMSFDDVRIHYSSQKPIQMGALAYTQGRDVYIAPRQEKYLEHELGHVVQQKRGIVRPDSYINSIPVNTDRRLEEQASLMGERLPFTEPSENSAYEMDVVQRSSILEEVMKLWESGKSLKTIAVIMGFSSVLAVYRLIKNCLTNGDGAEPVEEAEPVEKEDAPEEEELEKEKTSQEESRVMEEIPQNDGEFGEDKASAQPIFQQEEDVNFDIQTPQETLAEWLKQLAREAEYRLDSAYKKSEIRKRITYLGNLLVKKKLTQEMLQDLEDDIKFIPKKKRKHSSQSQTPSAASELSQEEREEQERRELLDQKTKNLLGEPDQEHRYQYTASPQGSYLRSVLADEMGIIERQENIRIGHQSHHSQEAKRFVVEIRGKDYLLFLANHVRNDNTHYQIETVVVKEMKRLEGKVISFKNNYFKINGTNLYL